MQHNPRSAAQKRFHLFFDPLPMLMITDLPNRRGQFLFDNACGGIAMLGNQGFGFALVSRVLRTLGTEH
jgi:hypothetical protein